jgi:hypothetical protein
MKNSLSFIGLVFGALLFSCEEQALNPNRESSPNISVTLNSPTPADSFQGNVLVEASATGKHRIVSMQILLDGNVIYTVSGSSISYILNTTEYEDGLHNLKIVAKDKKEAEGSVQMEMNFRNSFITLNFVLNNPEPGTQYYFYLNDEDGNVVSDMKQVLASTTQIKFNTPAGHMPGKKYALAYVEHWPSYYGYNAVTTLQVVTGYTEGTYNEAIGYPPYIPNPGIGTHRVNFNEPVTAAYHTEVGPGFVFVYNSTGVDLDLEKNGASAYVAVQRVGEPTPLYKMLHGLNVGETTNIDAAEFAPMQGVTIPSSPDANSTFSYVNATRTAGDWVNPKVIWYNYPFGGGPMEYNYQQYYPGNQFPEYMSGMFESNGIQSDQYVVVGPTAASEFKRITGEVSSISATETELSIQATGDYDFVQLGVGLILTWGAYADFTFSVTLQNGDLNYSLPQIPDELTSMFGFPALSSWNWPTQSISAYWADYSGVSGYGEYFEETFRHADVVNFNDWTRHSTEYTSRSRSFLTSSDARIGTARSSTRFYFGREKFKWGNRLE